MGTRTWGKVDVPEWALRSDRVRSLLDDHSEFVGVQDNVALFDRSEMCRDGLFPDEIHQTLQELEIPYDFKYVVLGEDGTRAGCWRPGMREPLEFWLAEEERLFLHSEIKNVIDSARSPVDQIRALTALLNEDKRVQQPLGQIPDPRLKRAEALRIDTQKIRKRRRKLSRP